jgi:hypothetical protein
MDNKSSSKLLENMNGKHCATDQKETKNEELCSTLECSCFQNAFLIMLTLWPWCSFGTDAQHVAEQFT